MIGEIGGALLCVVAAMYLAEYVVTPSHVGSFFGGFQSILLPLTLIYLPIFILRHKRRPIDFIDSRFATWWRGVCVGGVASIVVLPIFAWAALWVLSFGVSIDSSHAVIPSLNMVMTELVLVAFPEEFFFRGYLQSSFNRRYVPKWRVLGVSVGHGWWLTAALFAIAHSAISPQIWHLLIFFPALLFGYLRERSGGIVAPVIFHAASNLVMQWVLSAII